MKPEGQSEIERSKVRLIPGNRGLVPKRLRIDGGALWREDEFYLPWGPRYREMERSVRA
jgi:hypothetical protein